MIEKEFLKIYQIYFKEEQKESLLHEGYFNSDCTVFFENSVIRSLIEQGKHLNSRYFGVLPPDLQGKWNFINKRFFDPKEFNLLSIDLSSQHKMKKSIATADIVSFHINIKNDPITEIEWMHKDLGLYFKEVLAKIGYSWSPMIFNHTIYSNLFIAKSEIYERFVKEMLAPAMDIMLTMPELNSDSGYPKKLPIELKEKFGLEHYPYHTFICERLISFFIHIHKLNCKHF